MKQKSVSGIVLFISMMCLSGCGGRIVDWGTGCFYQGENRKEPQLPYAYVRSAKVHDQFTIVGNFDAIWLSDEVKTAYSHALMRKQGKDGELAQAFLRRQLEENRHFISFFVLIPYDKTLGELQSIWSVFLDIDGRNVVPLEVKKTDIDVVYQEFFDKKYSCFKSVYRVKFDARDADDVPFINENTQTIKLVFRSMAKETAMCWDAQVNVPNTYGIVEHNGPWDESLEEIFV